VADHLSVLGGYLEVDAVIHVDDRQEAVTSFANLGEAVKGRERAIFAVNGLEEAIIAQEAEFGQVGVDFDRPGSTSIPLFSISPLPYPPFSTQNPYHPSG
jgi:hypothetical protein